MSRTVTGLTVGHTYRVSAQAWTDNVNSPTALGLDFGPRLRPRNSALNLALTFGP